MAKYLITGIAGFIGSSLARALVERGEDVRGVDNYLTGKAANLAGYFDRIDFREVDLRDAAGIRTACEGIDYILHIGALPSVPLLVAHPEPSHQCNVEGTFHVLEGARAAGVKRIIYAASSSAYGNQPILPSKESMRPMPISPYAVQKLVGEYYMSSYWQVYGLETVSLRYFNVFGPRQGADSPYSGVLAKFIQQMLEGRGQPSSAPASRAETLLTLTTLFPPTCWPVPRRRRKLPVKFSIPPAAATHAQTHLPLAG